MNLIEWVAVHRVTGEEVDLDILQIRDGGNFNKVYVRALAEMIECTGDGAVTVLSYLLKNKDSKNRISGTQRIIAEESGAGVATVSRTFKALEAAGFLTMPHSGLYVLNPSVLHYGGIGNKVAIMRIWDGLDE